MRYDWRRPAAALGFMAGTMVFGVGLVSVLEKIADAVCGLPRWEHIACGAAVVGMPLLLPVVAAVVLSGFIPGKKP